MIQFNVPLKSILKFMLKGICCLGGRISLMDYRAALSIGTFEVSSMYINKTCIVINIVLLL